MNAHMSGYMRTVSTGDNAYMWYLLVISMENQILVGYMHMRCIYYLTCSSVYDIGLLMMNPAKKKTLLASGTLNPRPEAVRSELFKMDFFDPCDRAQVKYEMLRSHGVDEDPVAEACRQFGFSRESFYHIQEAFRELGFISFLPRKRGRKGPVKLKGEVLEFALEKERENPEIDPAQLAALIRERFGLEMHRTTVMRGIKKNGVRRRKNRREAFDARDDPVQAIYENVRCEALQNLGPPSWALERVRRYGVASLFPGSQNGFPFVLYAQCVPRPAWSGKRDLHRERLHQVYEFLIQEVTENGNNSSRHLYAGCLHDAADEACDRVPA